MVKHVVSFILSFMILMEKYGFFEFSFGVCSTELPDVAHIRVLSA